MSAKVERNAACPCGSGRKYKRCCGRGVSHTASLGQFAERPAVLTTFDGDAVTTQELFFDIVDRAELVRGLNASGEFDRSSDGNEFVWLGASSKAGRMGKSVLASLKLEGARLRALTMSNERGERLRALLERVAPGAARYRLREIQDIGRQVAERLEKGSTAPISREDQVEMMRGLAGQFYRDWVDEKIPALGGRTPRQAATEASQRPVLAALMREIESNEVGGVLPDLAWMWDELRLHDLK